MTGEGGMKQGNGDVIITGQRDGPTPFGAHVQLRRLRLCRDWQRQVALKWMCGNIIGDVSEWRPLATADLSAEEIHV